MNESSPILLIDSEDRHLSRLQQELSAAGHAVAGARSAKPALEKIAAEQPAAVLMAVSTVDGALLETVSRLRHAVGWMPLVIYSDRFREVTRMRFMEAGADDFVPAEAASQTVTELLCSARHQPGQKPRQKKTVAADPSPAPAREASAMYFKLQGGELSNALQFLCMSSRAGELEISLAGEKKGSLFIDQNTVSHAQFQDLEGIEALTRLLCVEQLEARFFEGRQSPRVTNQRMISQLLIEASVLADEMAANGAETRAAS